MNSQRKFAFVSALAATIFSLAGCGTVIGPGADVPTSSDVPSGLFCTLSNGVRCPAGTSCRAPDGCNTCRCPAGGGGAACTELGCVPPSGGPCSQAMPCANPALQECVYPVDMCGAMGTCQSLTDCAETQTFCGCDGRPFMGCPARPTRPNFGRPPCAGGGGPADAGL